MTVMAKQTKKKTRADIGPLWQTIFRTANASASMGYLGGVVKVERVYHCGRTGPAWTPSYSFYLDGVERLQSDSVATFVGQLHRYVIDQEMKPL